MKPGEVADAILIACVALVLGTVTAPHYVLLALTVALIPVAVVWYPTETARALTDVKQQAAEWWAGLTTNLPELLYNTSAVVAFTILFLGLVVSLMWRLVFDGEVGDAIQEDRQ